MRSPVTTAQECCLNKPRQTDRSFHPDLRRSGDSHWRARALQERVLLRDGDPDCRAVGWGLGDRPSLGNSIRYCPPNGHRPPREAPPRLTSTAPRCTGCRGCSRARSAWQQFVILADNLLTNFQIETGAGCRGLFRKRTVLPLLLFRADVAFHALSPCGGTASPPRSHRPTADEQHGDASRLPTN